MLAAIRHFALLLTHLFLGLVRPHSKRSTAFATSAVSYRSLYILQRRRYRIKLNLLLRMPVHGWSSGLEDVGTAKGVDRSRSGGSGAAKNPETRRAHMWGNCRYLPHPVKAGTAQRASHSSVLRAWSYVEFHPDTTESIPSIITRQATLTARDRGDKSHCHHACKDLTKSPSGQSIN